MKCTLNIDVDLIKKERPIPYKYVILSPYHEKGESDDIYESLLCSNNNDNRCLVVPNDACFPKGEI